MKNFQYIEWSFQFFGKSTKRSKTFIMALLLSRCRETDQESFPRPSYAQSVFLCVFWLLMIDIQWFSIFETFLFWDRIVLDQMLPNNKINLYYLRNSKLIDPYFIVWMKIAQNDSTKIEHLSDEIRQYGKQSKSSLKAKNFSSARQSWDIIYCNVYR